MSTRARGARSPSPLCYALSVLLVLIFASRAEATPDWSAPFDPAAVAANLPAGKGDYIVVGAGPATPVLRSATDALENGLRKGGRAGLVMNAAGLGTVEALDDAAIVARCAALPVGTIAVVRVFPGSDDDRPQAVVTLYDKKGKVKGAFSAAAGQPAGGKATEPAEGTGVSAAAVAGVSDVVRASGADTGAAQERYDRESLSVIASDSYIAASQGKYHRALEVPEFYRILGRNDLASAYEERRTFKIVLGVGGLAGFGAGIAMAINDPSDAAVVVCSAGLGVALLGLILPNANGLEPAELRESVDRYNGNLRKKLQLSVAPAPRPRLVWSPVVSATGGGLAVAGSF